MRLRVQLVALSVLLRSRGQRATASFVVVAGLMWATACARAPSAPSYEFTITQEDGVEVALTTGGPRFEGELFEYERILEIRPDPENEDSFLWGPQWMQVSDDGRIFISDMSADQIFVFDAAGEYLQKFGRKGEGPGEFRFLAFIELVGGELWATNMSPPLSQVFDLDGNFLRTVTIPDKAQGFVRDSRWWFLDDGRMAVATLATSQEVDTANMRTETRVIDAEGNVLASMDTAWVPQAEYLDPSDGGRTVPLQVWFAGMPSAAFHRDRGFYVSNCIDPEVRAYDIDGELRRIMRIDLPPEPVTGADRAWVLSQHEEQLQRALSPSTGSGYKPDPRDARIERDNPRYLDPKAYWQDIQVDDQGFVYLYVRFPENLPEGRTRWLVLSPEGEFLGQTISPGWSQIQRGILFAVEDDPETGERMPVLYRIHPKVEGLEYPR